MIKIKAALYTSLILSMFMMVISIMDGGLWIFPIVLIYALAGNVGYGIPVSLLSDWLTKKMWKGRLMTAGFIHALFGGLTYFVIDGFAWFAVICAVIFFFIDERLKKKHRSNVDSDNKRFYLKLGSVVFVLFAMIVVVNWIPGKEKEEGIKSQYLIPEGHEGTIVVFYGVVDQPALEKEDGFSMVPVGIESVPTLMRTDIERYGVYRTSTKDQVHHVSENQYFYVDEEGNRVLIEDECIYLSGGGRVTQSDGGEMTYDEFQVTNSSCGEDFHLKGNERYSAQGREIEKYYEEYGERDQ
ncbi:hypothetical protein [Rossellomorea sp. KS-H15a]|uniref:DUF6843 domain-containing protein n=1 Tax=Rossellomorea sp. KS-H15a TaxID=2963940 RepID=UPI0020C726EE|nr:hypothetical protein [Rossellomorea sp. KS-H15a]UTE78407.1 hypothetical protein M1J35_06475 [Rossellomorea sp. KS-H15a]